jgi:hypothetical protein
VGEGYGRSTPCTITPSRLTTELFGKTKSFSLSDVSDVELHFLRERPILNLFKWAFICFAVGVVSGVVVPPLGVFILIIGLVILGYALVGPWTFRKRRFTHYPVIYLHKPTGKIVCYVDRYGHEDVINAEPYKLRWNRAELIKSTLLSCVHNPLK